MKEDIVQYAKKLKAEGGKMKMLSLATKKGMLFALCFDYNF